MPRLGLALSGGTAKVIAHIGVLRALEEEGLPPAAIVGTSGGSLIGALYAAGLGPAELLEAANDINWRRLAGLRLPRLGLLSSQRIEDFVTGVIGEKRFEELRVPLHVVSTNVLTGESTIFCRGPVARAVRASCSIPQIFSPVEIDGGLYTDGAVLQYLPVDPLRELGLEVNIAVHLGAYLDFSERPRHLLSMVLRVMGIVAVDQARRCAPHADLLLEPDLRAFGGFDLGQAAEMERAGYEAARAALPHLRELMAPPPPRLWDRLRRGLGSGEVSGRG